MQDQVLLSTAYFPPVEYFSLIKNSGKILIEKQENYPRRTYRNRCRILASGGVLDLSVPVSRGGKSKALTRDVTIDYTKRWQQVHTRALLSAYNRSPFFEYYFDFFDSSLQKKFRFLLDLNTDILLKCLEILKINVPVEYTGSFIRIGDFTNDFRFSIMPGNKPDSKQKPYTQVFNGGVFIPGLSIIDLIFNTGPDAYDYL